MSHWTIAYGYLPEKQHSALAWRATLRVMKLKLFDDEPAQWGLDSGESRAMEPLELHMRLIVG
jgi:hypothetical protein